MSLPSKVGISMNYYFQLIPFPGLRSLHPGRLQHHEVEKPIRQESLFQNKDQRSQEVTPGLFRLETTECLLFLCRFKYSVKPHSGVVEPNSEVSIAVSLQPFEFDPKKKNKHKFMVQSMFAPETGEINQDAMVTSDVVIVTMV